MATLIAFSARPEDYILVDTDLQQTNGALTLSNRTGSGLVPLTQIPVAPQRFEPTPVFVNPQRVAFIRTPAP